MGKIIGTELPDIIFGTPFDDYIAALGGNDTILGSAGNDTIDGDNDFDTVDYNTSRLNQAITLRPQGFVDKGRLGTDRLIEIERIVAPSGFTNTIDASSAGFLTFIKVNLEKNSLVVKIGRTNSLRFTVENFVNVIGTSSADTIIGNRANNDLKGLGGNDTLAGGNGNDRLDGGIGFDTADYNTSLKTKTPITLLPTGTVIGNETGIDQLVSVERIVAPLGLANTINASSATGTTAIDVNLEKNRLLVNNIPGVGTLTFTVEQFVNVTGTRNADNIVGNSNNNVLTGSGGNDTLVGGFGNDVLNGTDALFRGKGEIDVLTGGQNFAKLWEGTDTDTFIIGDALGSYYKFAGKLDFALINDFSFGEQIQLGAKDTYVIEQDLSGFDIFAVVNGAKDLIADVFVQGFSIDLPKGEFQLAAGETAGNFVGAV